MGACAEIPGINTEISKAKKCSQDLKKQQDELTKQEASLKQQAEKLQTNIKQTQLRLEKHQNQLKDTLEQKRRFDDARLQFTRKANHVRTNLGKRVPAARFWLKERQEALKEFERYDHFLAGSRSRDGNSATTSSSGYDSPLADFADNKAPSEKLPFDENDPDRILYSLLPFIIRIRNGQLNYILGKQGERVAARILSEQFGVTISAIATAQGVDLMSGEKRNGKFICAEVKTGTSDKPFEQLLNRAYGDHLQCSDEWLRNVGIPDPGSVVVFGVLINPQTESCMIYRRMDDLAEHWDPIRSSWFPFTDFKD